ncbi:hypothetical protein [Bacteroides congonensis]
MCPVTRRSYPLSLRYMDSEVVSILQESNWLSATGLYQAPIPHNRKLSIQYVK